MSADDVPDVVSAADAVPSGCSVSAVAAADAVPGVCSVKAQAAAAISSTCRS